jgi:tRNA (Thr-GGU) A37 N-methylase
MNTITMKPVGTVRSTRIVVVDDNWDSEQGRIELDPAEFTPESMAGLADFSHVEV